jgi:hypothetical protein
MSIFGCAHTRQTFPLTPLSGPRKGQTYVACLSCGKEMAYSWDLMRIVEQPKERGELRAKEA